MLPLDRHQWAELGLGEISMTVETREPIWPTYLANEDVQKALAIADEFDVWTESSGLHSLALNDQATYQERMAIVAFLMVHEHQRSMIKLLEFSLAGSAATLMRPAFEAYARGLWLLHASDAQMEHFRSGGSQDVERLIRTVAKLTKDEKFAFLLDTWEQSKRSLHGFVHGSYQSLLRRTRDIDFPESEVADMLRFMTGMALHATLEMLGLAQRRTPHADRALHSVLIEVLRRDVVLKLYRMDLALVAHPAMEGDETT
ncbi:hypothetical protein GN331_14990 [Lysobacter sp. HX-5-24]|uniref:Uncharacterized protein n=1 Tax=Noviluteimonas gilva TaxID=2682097 RepID=A0A7C9HVD2_9GAMM|nr:hypothetical protein [Lysobacter gilvus]